VLHGRVVARPLHGPCRDTRSCCTQGYNLVRTHDGTGAFVIVDHDEEDAIQAGAPISNIYAAGANATLYTLSLRRNYRRGFITDFSRVEGLPGASVPGSAL